eukprot:g61399.t1
MSLANYRSSSNALSSIFTLSHISIWWRMLYGLRETTNIDYDSIVFETTDGGLKNTPYQVAVTYPKLGLLTGISNMIHPGEWVLWEVSIVMVDDKYRDVIKKAGPGYALNANFPHNKYDIAYVVKRWKEKAKFFDDLFYCPDNLSMSIFTSLRTPVIGGSLPTIGAEVREDTSTEPAANASVTASQAVTVPAAPASVTGSQVVTATAAPATPAKQTSTQLEEESAQYNAGCKEMDQKFREKMVKESQKRKSPVPAAVLASVSSKKPKTSSSDSDNGSEGAEEEEPNIECCACNQRIDVSHGATTCIRGCRTERGCRKEEGAKQEEEENIEHVEEEDDQEEDDQEEDGEEEDDQEEDDEDWLSSK